MEPVSKSEPDHRPEPDPGPPARRSRPSRQGPGYGLAAASLAVRSFLGTDLEARETRITRIGPTPDGGWDVEAEILVPDLNIKTLGLPLTQEVLERQACAVHLGPTLEVIGFERIDREE